LKKLPFKLVYESYRGKDWELFLMNADGSGGKNLTNTPDADDMYPHASPDGKDICFVVDQGKGSEKSRSVYLIGADGGGRRLIARDARQPCWSPDGRKIAYLPAEFKRFSTKDFATKGVAVFDVKAAKGSLHTNDKLHHLYNLCWSPDGEWFTATVHGGMGHKHANLAFEAGGTKVFKLPGVNGCRPDISPDGKKISWNPSDHAISVGDLQLDASGPKVTNIRNLVTCDKKHEMYHSDWSPDGKYVAFSYGPKGGEQVGTMAKGWHIAVADAAATNVWVTVTKDGVSNKEADWVAVAAAGDSKQARLQAQLSKLSHKIVLESYRKGNWDIFMMSADGSAPVNLTNTPDGQEMYPHASPDGGKICFVADEGSGRDRQRNVYLMNADGSGRTLVAKNARQPCWSPDGRKLLYAQAEYRRFTYSSYGTKGLVIYDPASRKASPHPNTSILHATYLCWAPGAKWILATVHGGMGFKHGDLAIEAEGKGVFRLKDVNGCRMDVSSDGKKILWNADDRKIVTADIDLQARPPTITNVRTVVSCDKKHMVYHGDWSPDGKYIAFSHGPNGQQHVGRMARGWHTCVADAAETNVWVIVTTDGESNKEPDWVRVAPKDGKQ
jgi:Tol biopolymer transport system component